MASWQTRRPTIKDEDVIYDIVKSNDLGKFPIIDRRTVCEHIIAVLDGHFGLVSMYNGKVEGFIHGKTEWVLNNKIAGNVAILVQSDIPPYRKASHMIELIREFHKWAKEHKCNSVEWTTATGEWKALQHILEHMKCRQIGVVMEYECGKETR